jgi:phage gpG-like protein
MSWEKRAKRKCKETADMPLNFTYHLDEVKAFFRKSKTTAGNNRRGWKAALIVYYQFVEKAFNEQGIPDKWAPLKPDTLRRRRKGKNKNFSTRILQDTGYLKKAATTPNSPGSFTEITPTRLTVGVTVKYAAPHQYGYPPKNIPARPFFTAPDTVRKNMATAWIEEYYKSITR